MSLAATGTRRTHKPTATRQSTAKRWTCGECGVSVGRMDGGRVPLPESWSHSREGTFCLLCRRERAARAALEAAPAGTGLEERAKLQRAALIEFEVSRRPEESDGMIAKTCRSSVAAVAAARRRLDLPAPQQPRR
ncbi:MAG TPA: hypothetical protein VHI77_10725 [Solirubrobacterales bacterium]|jgi:hypothetical protein|nr:hypothetical protein [Solirubrobacterales bacterium]